MSDGASGGVTGGAQVRTVTGVDVSEWQDGLPLSAAAQAGHRFAIVRACDGTRPDRVFASHAADAHASGLIVGAYWFVRHPGEGTSFAEQAKVVAKQLASLADAPPSGSCGPVPIPGVWLDAETPRHRLSADDVAAAADALDAEGVACAGIYTARSYWRLRRFPGPGRVPGGLWLAQWPGDTGDDGEAAYPGDGHPAWRPFRGRTPDLWQYTDRGRVGGFTVDLNAYRGGPEKLRATVTGSAVN